MTCRGGRPVKRCQRLPCVPPSGGGWESATTFLPSTEHPSDGVLDVRDGYAPFPSRSGRQSHQLPSAFFWWQDQKKPLRPFCQTMGAPWTAQIGASAGASSATGCTASCLRLACFASLTKIRLAQDKAASVATSSSLVTLTWCFPSVDRVTWYLVVAICSHPLSSIFFIFSYKIEDAKAAAFAYLFLYKAGVKRATGE